MIIECNTFVNSYQHGGIKKASHPCEAFLCDPHGGKFELFGGGFDAIWKADILDVFIICVFVIEN